MCMIDGKSCILHIDDCKWEMSDFTSMCLNKCLYYLYDEWHLYILIEDNKYIGILS